MAATDEHAAAKESDAYENPTKRPKKAAKEAVETAIETAAETAAVMPAKEAAKVEKAASARCSQVMKPHQHHVVQLRYAQYDFPSPRAGRRSARLCEKQLDQLYK